MHFVLSYDGDAGGVGYPYAAATLCIVCDGFRVFLLVKNAGIGSKSNRKERNEKNGLLYGDGVLEPNCSPGRCSTVSPGAVIYYVPGSSKIYGVESTGHGIGMIVADVMSQMSMAEVV